MIKSQEPLSMPEALDYAEKAEGDHTDIIGFFKKFTKLNKSDAEKFSKKLFDLDILKLKRENIIKVIDLMPESAEELNKIFVDIGLDEEEAKKILEVVKEFK